MLRRHLLPITGPAIDRLRLEYPVPQPSVIRVDIGYYISPKQLDHTLEVMSALARATS